MVYIYRIKKKKTEKIRRIGTEERQGKKDQKKGRCIYIPYIYNMYIG